MNIITVTVNGIELPDIKVAVDKLYDWMEEDIRRRKIIRRKNVIQNILTEDDIIENTKGHEKNN